MIPLFRQEQGFTCAPLGEVISSLEEDNKMLIAQLEQADAFNLKMAQDEEAHLNVLDARREDIQELEGKLNFALKQVDKLTSSLDFYKKENEDKQLDIADLRLMAKLKEEEVKFFCRKANELYDKLEERVE